jgi:glycerophosphoryl diester phosphodiesterase
VQPPRPLIIAHRGASKYAPENSLAAIRKAIALGVDGVELDVQLTKEKVPVLLHDNDLADLTTSYEFIHRTPLRALRTIPIPGPGSSSQQHECIPTLAEALEILAPTPLLINLEIKPQPYWHLGIEERVVRLVLERGLAERTTFSSFSPLALFRLRHLAPSIPRGFLINGGGFSFLQANFFGKFRVIDNLHCAHPRLTPQRVTQARAAGWRIWSWTVNDRTTAEEMLALHVDAIITDDPQLVQEVVMPRAHEC